jgi:hypothetical protein
MRWLLKEKQAFIQERMAGAGIRNMGAYMRRIALRDILFQRRRIAVPKCGILSF